MKHILMLVTKDWQHDPRVRKEWNSLSNRGYRACILSDKNPSGGVLSTVGRHMRFYMRCLFESHGKKVDYIHAHDFDTLPLGVLLSKLKGVPLIYDAHESYSDMVANEVPETISNLLRFMEHRLTHHTTHIILANEKIGPLISDEPDKWLVVMNCPGRLPYSAKDDDGKYVLGYFGSLERGRFVQGLIDAVNMTDDWWLVLAGKGSLKLKDDDNGKVQNHGHLNPEEARQLMSKCDLLSVLFEPGNTNDYIGTPNRLFEAMAMGVPVVANWNTYSGQITKETGCGFVIDANIFPLKYLMEYISREPSQLLKKGMKGYDSWLKKYNWETQERKLIAMYDGMEKVSE